MNCPMCNAGRMVDDVMELSAGLDGGGELVLENIPCKKCDSCGEALFSKPTVVKLKALRDFYRPFSGQTFVVDFQNVAFGKA